MCKKQSSFITFLNSDACGDMVMGALFGILFTVMIYRIPPLYATKEVKLKERPVIIDKELPAVNDEIADIPFDDHEVWK